MAEPKYLKNLVEENFLTPTLSYRHRQTVYPCRCKGTTHDFSFYHGKNIRLRVATIEHHYVPACVSSGRHFIPPSALPFFTVVVQRTGGMQTVADDRHFRIDEGAYQIFSGVNQGGSLLPYPKRRVMKWLALAYHPDLVAAILEQDNRWSGERTTFDVRPRKLSSAARSAIDLVERGMKHILEVGSTMLVETATTQFFTLLLHEHPNSLSAPSRRRFERVTRDPRVKSALAYLQTHHQEEVTVEEIAKESGLSRSHLLALFKSQVGISPHQYMLRYRLRRAADLLQTTPKSVQEVGALVGFDDPDHFRKMFRKHFGAGPRSFRRSLVTCRRTP